MTAQTTSETLTIEEFTRLYAGKRYEYIDGRAVPMGPEITGEDGEVSVSPGKAGHGLIIGRLTIWIGQIVLTNHVGEIFGAETGFIMQDEPREIRAADVAFYSRERLGSIKESDWLPFPPDLAVEVVSEYDRAADLRLKVHAYIENGTRLLLIVYPDSKEVEVHQPDKPIQNLTEADTLTGGDVLSGLAVPLKDLFAGLDELQNS